MRGSLVFCRAPRLLTTSTRGRHPNGQRSTRETTANCLFCRAIPGSAAADKEKPQSIYLHPIRNAGPPAPMDRRWHRRKTQPLHDPSSPFSGHSPQVQPSPRAQQPPSAGMVLAGLLKRALLGQSRHPNHQSISLLPLPGWQHAAYCSPGTVPHRPADRFLANQRLSTVGAVPTRPTPRFSQVLSSKQIPGREPPCQLPLRRPTAATAVSDTSLYLAIHIAVLRTVSYLT